MSEYVSMKSITLKNKIMTPSVLDDYRAGTISYKTLQNTSSPLQDIYSNTYNYLTYPDLSQEVVNMLPQTKMTIQSNPLYRISPFILPYRKD